MPLAWPLILSAVLFGIGLYGVLARRHAVLVLIGAETMLAAVVLDLVALDAWWGEPSRSGQVLALFVVAVAAAGVGLGLAVVLLLHRATGTVDVDASADAAVAEDAEDTA